MYRLMLRCPPNDGSGIQQRRPPLQPPTPPPASKHYHPHQYYYHHFHHHRPHCHHHPPPPPPHVVWGEFLPQLLFWGMGLGFRAGMRIREDDLGPGGNAMPQQNAWLIEWKPAPRVLILSPDVFLVFLATGVFLPWAHRRAGSQPTIFSPAVNLCSFQLENVHGGNSFSVCSTPASRCSRGLGQILFA